MSDAALPDPSRAEEPHWTEPGAWPVAPGVHRIPLPLPMDGLRAVNVYALETDRGLTLIDAGWAIEEARTLLERSLKEIGYAVSDINRFLVTHVHRDHYTQAVTVRREIGAHVSLGLGDKPTLDLILDEDNRPEEDPHLQMMRDAGAVKMADAWAKMSEGMTPDLTLWEYPDTWLESDHTIDVDGRALDAVHTPGHTQGHFVFADQAASLLFAGDHVLPTITPSIGFEPVLAAQPLGDFLGSLAKVRALPDLTLLPAHGPVAPSSHARVDELVVHHDERLALCLAALPAGGGTAYDVALELPWTRHERRMRDLDLFNAALATLETRAHLELLVARGELTRTPDQGGFVYQRPPE
ncbi:MBL fold metallo-hydrolase [Nocardioides speluncae]|uniref:MBL fold metallo-hydrolase n=1 Tax=Nocardioides speluncae TaxID=2670337 RepID=UPI000D69F7E6|nr:MBL fold metallo-hydrolase [Nocardioides speluncae]